MARETGSRGLVVKEPRLRCPPSRVRALATADLTWFPFALQDLPCQFRLDACDHKGFLDSMTNHYEVRRIRVFLPLKTLRVAKGNRTQGGTHSYD
ncbi:hypothetical protein Bca101_039355 [Brassica carinata]